MCWACSSAVFKVICVIYRTGSLSNGSPDHKMCHRCRFQCSKNEAYVDWRPKRGNIKVVYKSALVWTWSQWPLKPECGISCPFSHSVENMNRACKPSTDKQIPALYIKHFYLSDVFVTLRLKIRFIWGQTENPYSYEGEMCLGKVNLSVNDVSSLWWPHFEI